ncbi:helix-turn-helix domain-containing protein [Pseudomonas versuta]|uniref:HTH araC/xylS-type domain-containing protein n=1 Tax=Pseudomonas versuta TaxID=1788301 RepID=A0ABX3E5Q7_9PSED|nr:helix-turn-helix domain-containing protein [Pseudomonas versuta]ALE87801.1 hypothetical protein AOC04_06070 [Pseudomonas versuta]OKA19055.1 hypothetical protein BOH73_18120 [Pseudomonas versuta]
MRQSLHTTDIFEHANALPGWRQRYDQLSCGRLEGWLDVVQAGEVQLFRECLNQQVIQHICLPRNAVNILFPLAWPAVDYQGTMAEKCATVLLPNDEYRVFTPAGMDVLCMSIPYATLRGLLDEAVLYALMQLDRPKRVCLRTHRLAPGIVMFKALMEGSPTSSTWQSLTLMAVEWLEQVIDVPQETPRPGTHNYIVERCHQWLIEEPAAPTNVLEFCRRLKVSRRTLQYSFQSVAAVTPVQYLRSVRLNGARRALKEDPYASIADIAERWGFGHSSYFTLEYQKLFKELPSALRCLERRL